MRVCTGLGRSYGGRYTGLSREEVGCVCRGGGSCGPGVSAPIDITVVGAHDSRQDFVASDETCISYYVIQWLYSDSLVID